MGECGTVSCILSYNGSEDDVIINYITFAVSLCGGAAVLALQRRSVNPHIFQLMVLYQASAVLGLFAYQVGLCLALGCAGISIVWNAMNGFLGLTLVYQGEGWAWPFHGLQRELIVRVALGTIAFGLAVDVYYAVAADLVTTIAHLAAILVGMLIGFVFVRIFPKGDGDMADVGAPLLDS